MADVDLIFGRVYVPQPADDLTLTFGAFAGGVGAPSTFAGVVRFGGAITVAEVEVANATFAGTVRFGGAITVDQTVICPAAFAGTVRFGGALTADYDLDVPDYSGGGVTAGWRRGNAVAAAAVVPWHTGDPLGADHAGAWQQAAPVRPGDTVLPWHQAARVRPGVTALPWRPAAPVRPGVTVLPWRDGAVVSGQPVRLPWQQGRQAVGGARLPWQQGARLHAGDVLSWRDGALALLPHALRWGLGRAVAPSVRLPWQHGLLLETDGGSPWPVVTVEPPFAAPVDLRFCQVWLPKSAWQLPLILGVDPCGGLVPALVVVPTKRTYIVINDTHLIKLDGMLELPALTMQLTLDVDSWTWSFNATLRADQLPQVIPGDDGTPVLLAMVVNGQSFYVLAENLQRERTFGQETIRIGGRGKNALLDAPYAITQSFGNASDRLAAQLLDDALTLNGVSIGWSVDSALTDWLVPAGIWSHTGSHMSAALSVARAAGGYVQPHPTDDTLRVLARYPVAPWDWGELTPEIELPSAVATVEGIAWAEKARYNAVYVSGQGAGVLCQVVRTGTAGDVIAPMVMDPLITEAAAGGQRGLTVLADTGRVATVSLRVPVLPETGVIMPGPLLRYVDGSDVWLGLVRSLSLSVEFNEVWQTIGVETHDD